MNISEVRGRMRTNVKPLAFNLLLLAGYAWSAIWAVHDESWGVLAVVITILAIFGCIKVWLRRRRIEFDHDGQPLTGRDADRLAIARLRAYRKNQRRIAHGESPARTRGRRWEPM